MKTITRHSALALVAILNLTLFENCNGFRMSFDLPSSDTGLPPGVLADQTGDTVSAKILTADQMLVSFGQLTKVNPTSDKIKTEFSNRSGVLADGFALSAVSAPLLIGVANLTSQFCDEAIGKEQTAAPQARRLFNNVDFNSGLTAFSSNSYQAMVSNLALKFWGREISAAEQAILSKGRLDFENSFVGNRETGAAVVNLVLYTCTGMLSSFDSITF